jgi:hypothetical protein
MKFILKNTWLVMTAFLAVMTVSCKRTYTDPPPTGAPNIVANTTIAALKSRFTAIGTTVQITDDVVISGIVNADDRSGNYYQQISIQDSTGGIIIRLAGSNLYTQYPVGRQIFVKCKGLFLGEYGRMIQLGAGEDRSGNFVNVTMIAPNLQDQYIVKGPLNQTLIPKTVTVSQLGTSLQDPYVNTLVRFDNFEFASSELGKNYADDNQSGNRIIQGCTTPSSNRLTLRTSNYSNFATVPVPQGNGEIVGIYTIFNSTKQFTIRDTTDVRFYGPRCPTPAGGGSITLTTSPLIFDFDNIATAGLPAGVYVKENASSIDLGFDGTVYNGNFTTPTLWNQTSGGFKNVASATGLTATATTQQNTHPNRALGLRQTGSVGDPGAAFAFLLANTTGKTNLQMEFKLQSLDSSATTNRTTTWKVDYAIGQSPTAFSTVTTNPTTLTTINGGVGSFKNTTVTVNFGSLLNNVNQPVWIRIVALTPATGSGNRPTTAIDDVKFTWN